MFTTFPGRISCCPCIRKLMFNGDPDLFRDTYHFSPGISGLCYIGLGISFVAATFFSAILSNRIYFRVRLIPPNVLLCAHPPISIQLSQKNGGVGKPEYRIPVVLLGSLLVPIGLLCVPLFRMLYFDSHLGNCSWYGWSAQAGIQWIMPIIGTAIFGFGVTTAT